MKALRLLVALVLAASGAACSTTPTSSTRSIASRTAPPAFTPRTASTAVPGTATLDAATTEPTTKSSWLTPVKPWQRGHLAEYVMLPNRDPLTSSIAEHVYFTREAFAGGRGVGGGGCGCN